MNQNQKIVAGIICGVLVIILLFPPFAQYRGPGIKVSVGCSFISKPPARGYAGIDAATLFIEYLVTITVGGIAFYAFKDRNNKGG